MAGAREWLGLAEAPSLVCRCVSLNVHRQAVSEGRNDEEGTREIPIVAWPWAR